MRTSLLVRLQAKCFVAPGVYREGGLSSTASWIRGRWRCLSGLTGNCHGPFLGEGAAETPSPYPTKGEKEKVAFLSKPNLVNKLLERKPPDHVNKPLGGIK